MDQRWTGIKIGHLALKHRLALAPMTRLRAKPDGTPSELAIEYYKQRASLGLLISEGTQPSAMGRGYVGSPGIHNASHIQGWKKIADAVHADGGHLYIQLMHAGRVSHPDLLENQLPVAPSAIATPQKIFTQNGEQEAPVPKALSKDELAQVEAEFVQSAQNAIEAGADGVEIHGANGYLLWQFLNQNSNQRDDEYGGSIENRVRFPLQVTKAIANAIGAKRTGIRLSPNMNFLGMHEDENWQEIYRYYLTELEKLSLAYVHLFYFGDDAFLQEVRSILKTTPLLLVKAGRQLESIQVDLKNNFADVFPIATLAISNPDLVQRLQHDLTLTEPNPETFYGGGAEGYIDYPFAHE